MGDVLLVYVEHHLFRDCGTRNPGCYTGCEALCRH